MNKRHIAEIKKSILPRAAASLLLVLSVISSTPANATLLHGYINGTGGADHSGMINSARVVEQQAAARSDSFPTELQGAWQCVTVVVDSLVDSVAVGQKVVSQMEFVKSNDGRVVARFVQPGWTEAQESITAYSSTQYQMDKTNYYYGDRANGAWAARSRDHYQVLEKNRMIAEGEVDQYINGKYVGRYRTRSTISRINTGIENLAATPMPDPDDQSGDIKPGFGFGDIHPGF
ncbi:MAG: hypothetical protein K2X81_23000 [Candidatus Obscuribacterales bacterium]|nr:hypothetical protein [Candidatus Obscuribacterales bacterium]